MGTFKYEILLDRSSTMQPKQKKILNYLQVIIVSLQNKLTMADDEEREVFMELINAEALHKNDVSWGFLHIVTLPSAMS